MSNMDTFKLTNITRVGFRKPAFVTLLLASSCVKIDGQTPFKESKFNHCPTDLIGDAMFAGTDVTITKCVKMCALRPWCVALIYRRLYPLCELYSNKGLEVLETTEVAGYCQYVDKGDFSAEFAELTDQCETLAALKCDGEYAACDIEGNQCVKPECPRIDVVENGRLLGNMNGNGARKQLICDAGYNEEAGASITTCRDGDWTPPPKCVFVFTGCSPNPCKNGGTCTINGTGYVCECQPGWIGTNCLTKTFMTLPDYESVWTDIASSSLSATSYKEFKHGLGEVPLLVDVQVKAIDGLNKGYIFQATGHQQRDDDDPEEYGGVIYIYSKTSVRVSAPLKSNHNLGRTIYTGVDPYWVGPYEQDSWSAQVRVRCWKESSLPKPDFKSPEITIKSTTGLAKDSYKKISHGIKGTPNLVVSRIRFDTTMYADSVGSAGVIYLKQKARLNGYVVFGYDSSDIQVWAPSDSSGRLVNMGDGYGISAGATDAKLQLYAWSNQTLPYNTNGTLKLSLTQIGSKKILAYEPAGNENQTFTRSWIQSSTGPSSGYMFPGTGALSYETTDYDQPCTYGGMVYAYTNQSARFWQPKHDNGAIVCIASCLGGETNKQALKEGTAVLYSWKLACNDRPHYDFIEGTLNCKM